MGESYGHYAGTSQFMATKCSPNGPQICWKYYGCACHADTGLRRCCSQHRAIQYTFSGPSCSDHRDIVPADTKVGNHTGYKQWKGTKASAEEIKDLYTGLKQSYLTDFDVLLTGYAPSAETVDAVGSIARDLKLKGSMKAGSFFWSKSMVLGPANKDNS